MAEAVEIKISVEMQAALDNINSFQQKSSKDFDAINNNLENIANNTNNFSRNVKLAGASLAVFGGVMATNGEVILNTSKGIAELLFSYQSASKASEILTKTVSGFSKALISTDKSIIGVSSNIALAGIAIGGLGVVLNESNNRMSKFTGGLLVLTGTALVGFSVALNETILLTGKFINKIGTALVDVAQKATHSFIELDKVVFIFNRTVESFNSVTKGATGTAESWDNIISEIAKNTGFATVALRDSTKELVAALGPLGFNQEELKKLLEITTDYAAQVGGDSLQATLDFVSAINGNAQSVLKYGVKLSDSNVQQHLFAEGLNKNFESMSDLQKMTARYNTILDKHIPIAGAAAAVTTTLAGQQKVLENRLLGLNQSFGAGAAIVENSNIVNLGFNKILSTINDTVVESFGFITALGGRILQIGGFFLEWSIKIALVFKAYKLLNVLLQTNIIQTALLTPIPFLNKSLTEMIALLGGGTSGLTSMIGVLKTFISILSTQLVSTLKVVGVGLKAVFLNPAFLTATAIVSGIVLIYEAFKTLEEKTGVISDLLDVLKDSFSGLSPIMRELASVFEDIGDFAGRVLSTAFGLLIATISNLIEVSLDLIEYNPFGIFDDKTVERVGKINKTLTTFNNNLSDASYNITEIGSSTSSSLKKISKEMTEGSLKAVFALETELKKAGKTEIQIATDVKNDRLKIINDALKDGIILEGQYIKDKKLIEIDFQNTVGIIRKKQHEEELARQKAELEHRKKIFDYIKQQTEQAASAGGVIGLIPGLQNPNAELAPVGMTPAERSQAQLGTTIGGIAGLLNSMLKGAEGATKLVSGIIANIADTLLPGIGGAVGEIIGVLAQGPEKVKEMITGFINAIPIIVENIITSLPVLIEALADGIPEVINRIADKADVIVEALIDAMPRVIEKMSYAMAIKIPIAVANGIFKVLQAILSPLINIGATIAAIPTAFVAAAVYFVGKLVEQIPQILKSIADAIGPIIGNILSELAKGLNDLLFSILKFINDLISNPGEMIKKIGDGIVDILKKAITSIGEWVSQALKDVFSSTIKPIFDEFVKIITPIIEGLSSVFNNIILALGNLWNGLTNLFSSIGNAALDFGKIILTSASLFLTGIFNGAVGFIQQLIDGIKGAFSVGGGGGGGTSSAGSAYLGYITGGLSTLAGLASGGTVPSGFPNDTFSAKLSSGEMVVPRNDVDRLSAFLDKQSNQTINSSSDIVGQLKQVITSSMGEKNINITLQVGEKELASVILGLNRNGFRTA